jgi:hypothetical protein
VREELWRVQGRKLSVIAHEEDALSALDGDSEFAWCGARCFVNDNPVVPVLGDSEVHAAQADARATHEGPCFR